MSKSSELDRKVKTMLINGIDLSAYYEDADQLTTEEKIARLHEVFLSEYGWQVERIGKQAAIREWLQGLPTAISFPFYNSDILRTAREWGSLSATATESEEDRILDNYFNLLAGKLDQLFRGSNLPK